MVELTFDVSSVKQKRTTKRKLSSPSSFNVLMLTLKVPRESSRRARSLDFAVMKAQEFRNISIFFFIIILDCIEESAKDRKLWLLYAFVIRACILPSKEFQQINLGDINMYCRQLYKLYEAPYGPHNGTYNTHVVFSHLLDMREQGPLTQTSAYSFENFYGEIRNSFVPGTISPLKQIMKKVFLKRKLISHSCE